MAFMDRPFGFAGERKAIALTCLGFYAAVFGLLSLLLSNAPPDQPEVRAWWPCFAALGGCYGLSFFALGADWFWARWFAIGLGYSGVTVAGWSLFTMRSLDPVMMFYGLTHGAIALFLQGQKLTDQFDAKPGWRETLNLDDNGVAKVRHTITRAAASLPTLILIALAPKEGRGELLLLAAAGLFGVLWLRTWGVLLLLGLGLSLPLLTLHTHPPTISGSPALLAWPLVHQLGLVSAAFLCAASIPFVRPIAQFLGGRSGRAG